MTFVTFSQGREAVGNLLGLRRFSLRHGHGKKRRAIVAVCQEHCVHHACLKNALVELTVWAIRVGGVRRQKGFFPVLPVQPLGQSSAFLGFSLLLAGALRPLSILSALVAVGFLAPQLVD